MLHTEVTRLSSQVREARKPEKKATGKKELTYFLKSSTSSQL
jgi:hypothetical protein